MQLWKSMQPSAVSTAVSHMAQVRHHVYAYQALPKWNFKWVACLLQLLRVMVLRCINVAQLLLGMVACLLWPLQGVVLLRGQAIYAGHSTHLAQTEQPVTQAMQQQCRTSAKVDMPG